MWEMDQPWEGFDNVILASPVLKTRRMSDNGTTIEFIYTNFPDADAESALNCSYDALKFFRAALQDRGRGKYLYKVLAFSLRHFGRLQPQKLHYAQFRVFQRIYTQKYRP